MNNDKIKLEIRIKGEVEELNEVLREITRELHDKFGQETDLIVIGERR